MLHKTEAQKRLGVRIHAISFFAIMLPAIAINLWAGPPYWVAWVFVAWSVGLLSHWYFTVGRGVSSA